MTDVLDVAALARLVATCADDIEAPPEEAYLTAVQAGVAPLPSFATAVPKVAPAGRSIEWDVLGRRFALGVVVVAMLLAVVLIAVSRRGSGDAGARAVADPPLPSTARTVRAPGRSTTIAALPVILGTNADETAGGPETASSSLITARATTTTGTTVAVTTSTTRRPTTSTTRPVVVTAPVTEPPTTSPVTPAPTTVTPTTAPATTAPATTRPATTVPATTVPATTVPPTTTTTTTPGTLTVMCSSFPTYLLVQGAWTGAGGVVITVPWGLVGASVNGGVYSVYVAVPLGTTRPIPVAADAGGHHATTSC